MKYQKFNEYVTSKGKIKKPVVDASGDQLDVKNPPNSPPKPKKGRYKPGVCKPKTPKGTDWTSLGQKELIYKPDIKGTSVKAAKIPTAEQYKMTQAVVQDMQADPALIENFVRTMKQAGLLGALVAEVFSVRETTGHLAEILASESYGPNLLKKITKSLNEEVAKPYSDEIDGTSDEEEDPFAEEEDDEDIGNGTEDGQDTNMQVGQEPEMDPNQDPSAQGMDPMMGMDPNMGADPAAQGMDPSMMGGDPSMMGMDPNMGGMQQPPMMQPPMQQQPQPPMNPMMAQMQKFQRAMMRAHQRAMMRKG